MTHRYLAGDEWSAVSRSYNGPDNCRIVRAAWLQRGLSARAQQAAPLHCGHGRSRQRRYIPQSAIRNRQFRNPQSARELADPAGGSV
ncbi:MAG: hypothetical protein M3Z04_06915 [Chloroflexota bacterium]|nr:hypothetical protein [Chloroflexota bacterium]